MEHIGMNHSPHYSRLTLKIKNPSLQKKYTKMKRSEAFHNLKVWLILQTFHHAYNVYASIREKEYIELLSLIAYLCSILLLSAAKKYPWLIDGATTILQLLKSVTVCYIQYQLMIFAREQEIPTNKFYMSFVLLVLVVIYLLEVSFVSTSWAFPVIGGFF